MPLQFLLDEHLRRILWQAIATHNALGVYVLDAVRVGDPADLPLGSMDPDVLIWGEREGRILVTRDHKTMRRHLINHLSAGRHSHGVMRIRKTSTPVEVVEFLVVAAYASDPAEWQDQFRYIP